MKPFMSLMAWCHNVISIITQTDRKGLNCVHGFGRRSCLVRSTLTWMWLYERWLLFGNLTWPGGIPTFNRYTIIENLWIGHCPQLCSITRGWKLEIVFFVHLEPLSLSLVTRSETMSSSQLTKSEWRSLTQGNSFLGEGWCHYGCSMFYSYADSIALLSAIVTT